MSLGAPLTANLPSVVVTTQGASFRLTMPELARLEEAARKQAQKVLKAAGAPPKVQLQDSAWKMGEISLAKGTEARDFRVFLQAGSDDLLHVLAAKENQGMALDCGPVKEKELLTSKMPQPAPQSGSLTDVAAALIPTPLKEAAVEARHRMGNLAEQTSKNVHSFMHRHTSPRKGAGLHGITPGRGPGGDPQ